MNHDEPTPRTPEGRVSRALHAITQLRQDLAAVAAEPDAADPRSGDISPREPAAIDGDDLAGLRSLVEGRLRSGADVLDARRREAVAFLDAWRAHAGRTLEDLAGDAEAAVSNAIAELHATRARIEHLEH